MERWRLRDIVGVKAWGLCPSFDHARERFNSIPAERWHILSDARHNEQYNGVLSGTGDLFLSLVDDDVNAARAPRRNSLLSIAISTRTNTRPFFRHPGLDSLRKALNMGPTVRGTPQILMITCRFRSQELGRP